MKWVKLFRSLETSFEGIYNRFCKVAQMGLLKD